MVQRLNSFQQERCDPGGGGWGLGSDLMDMCGLNSEAKITTLTVTYKAMESIPLEELSLIFK